MASRIIAVVAGLTEQQQRAVLAVVATADPYMHAIVESAKAQIKGLDDFTDQQVIQYVGRVLDVMHGEDVEAEVEAAVKAERAAALPPAKPEDAGWRPKAN